MDESTAPDLRRSRRVFELMRRVYSSDDTSELLEEVVNGVVDVLGFGVAALSQLEGTRLYMTNVAGPQEVRDAILGKSTLAVNILDEYAQGEQWGILRFVPHDRIGPDDGEDPTWIPDIEEPTEPDGWHPRDTLYAPLYSATGELLGNLAVDLPPGGKIPDLELREQLELFAVQAGLALSIGQQRERLTHRLALGEAVTEVARAGTTGDVDEVLDTCVRAVHRLLGADQVWVRSYSDDPGASDHTAGYPGSMLTDERIPSFREELTEVWRSSALIEVGPDGSGLEQLPRSRAAIEELLSQWDRPRALLVPLGFGSQLLGAVAAVYVGGEYAVSADDRDAIREVAQEVGRVLHATRLHGRERRLVSELQEVDRYKQELIATISHELKTPLTSIIGHLELMQDGEVDARSLAVIERNAQRLDRLTLNLLDYSRVQSRREKVRTWVDLSELGATSVELVSWQAEKAEVDLEVRLPSGPVPVEGDPEELARVVENLVGNAVKYTPAGGRVSVETGTDDGDAVLRVTDTGLGISSLDQQHLFSAFHRSSNPQALSMPGSGLGLAISQRIAEQHGGTIEVESELGEGSRFTLRVPGGLS